MAPQATRTRPTRDETRSRLFEAAAEVFEERGIGAASVEAIAEAAGFTRGAFYSNFSDKDDLIMSMLEDHVAQTMTRHMDLLAEHRDPIDFVTALKAMDRTQQDPLGRLPLLHIELILYVARSAAHRPVLAQRLQGRRDMVTRIVAGTTPSLGEPERIGALLIALEDGFRLHRLIDPDSTPEDRFLTSVSDLQRLLGIASADGEQSPVATRTRSRRQPAAAPRSTTS